MELKTLLNCEDFDPQYLFKIYKQTEEIFDLEKFKCFIESYIKKANKFEQKTGIPKKYFSEKINLALFDKSSYMGYSKVKNIYIYFNNNHTAIFLRNKQAISKIKSKNQKGNWLIEELDKLTIDYKSKNKDSEIDPILYLSDKFKIKKSNNFFARFYLNSIYDIVVKFNNKYFFFFTLEHINELSFINHGGNLSDNSPSNYLTDKDLLKMKRMLKINKIQISTFLNEKENSFN